MNVEQKHLLQSWRKELGFLLQSHYTKSISVRRLNYLLGFPAILISIAISGYVFFTITHNPTFWAKLVAGMLLMLSAILTALQTFLKYSEQSEHHRTASARYESLYHSVDQMLVFPPKEDITLGKWCDKLRERWDELNLEAPNVNKVEYKYAKNRNVKSTMDHPVHQNDKTAKTSVANTESAFADLNKEIHTDV